jgi:putative CocE/NonD family hydrolase
MALVTASLSVPDGLSGAAAAGGSPNAGPSVPAWLRYDRPATFDVARNEIRVPMRDGVGLRCTLVRPAKDGYPVDGPLPVIVSNFFAYRAFQETVFGGQTATFATRGYAVLLCSPRGSGGTPGEWRPFGEQEQRDLYDLIEWAGTQPWSSGKVGQTGISYGGISTYRAASSGAPHLVAAAPIVAFSDLYSEIIYPGGIRGSIFRWWPFVTWGTSAADQSPVDSAGLFSDYAGFEEQAQAHPTYDEYWRDLAIDHAALDAGNVPVLGIGGWHDLFPKGMVDNYRAARDQSWLMMLPWAHGDFVPGRAEFPVVDRALLAWFDHWLLGLPAAPLPSARVTSWQLPKATGQWVELADWPDEAEVTNLHLNPDGILASAAGAAGEREFPVNPFDNGCACTDHGFYGAPDDPANDQRVADESRLHFDSAPLREEAVIAGEPLARLKVALSADEGNLVVRLHDVAPDGTSSVITTGWLRASHRRGHEQPVAVVPGEVHDYAVKLWPTHWKVAAGHHLRLSISSGDLAAIEPNAPAGTVTVLAGAGGSTFDLPIRFE